MVKNPPAMQEIWVLSLDQDDPLEKGMATHSSILAWRIPWTEEPDRLQSMRSQRVKHDWATNISIISNNYANHSCYKTLCGYRENWPPADVINSERNLWMETEDTWELVKWKIVEWEGFQINMVVYTKLMGSRIWQIQGTSDASIGQGCIKRNWSRENVSWEISWSCVTSYSSLAPSWWQ